MKQIYQKTLLLLLFAMVMQTASAYDCIVDGIYYYLNYKDNTAKVTSKSGNYKYGGDIVIPASITYNSQSYDVTSINGWAFSGCVNLKSITIPGSIKSIGNKAFDGCSGLKKVIVPDIAAWCAINFVSNPLEYAHHIYSDADTEITALTIPNGVTSIGNSAFSGCIGLTSLTIPYSVTSIGDYAFHNCSSVKALNLQDGLTTIGKHAFTYCTSLTALTIPSSVEHIKDYAFEGCENLESLTFPDYDSNHKIYLYSRSFYGCGMKELHLKRNVDMSWDHVVYETFGGCKKLEYAYVDCTISEEFFNGCDKLEKIVIGPNGRGFENLKYYMCDMPSLKYIEVEAGNQHGFYSQDNMLYKRNSDKEYYGHGGDVLEAVANAKEGAVVIPDGVIGIGDFAFYGCKHITSVSIPQSVFRIESEAFTNCGIKSIEIPHTVKEMGGNIFSGDTIDVYLYGTPKFYSGNPFHWMKTNSRLFAFSGILKPENNMTKNNEEMPEIIIFDKPSVVINPTSITIKDIKLNNIDDELTGYYFDETGNTSRGGLEPNANNGVTYFMKTGKHGIAEGYYSLKTPSLKLTTEKPKVTSKGEAVVCASTNMDEAETHAGFEWRKTDAPDVVESRQDEAVIYNGKMEGKIKNLDASAYWKVRAYYKSDSGKMYYGDWIGFDPSDFSYFEPTVHTYGSPAVDGTSATLTGAVVEGTDEIQEQGFEYWKGSASARENRAPSNAQRVKASGQRMTATVTGLSNGPYTYCSYVKTAKGTFYGEEQTFTITEGSGGEGGGSETKTKTLTVTTSKAGYATFYDSQTSYTLPAGLTAQVVTAVANDKLTYETIGSTVPKGVAVVLKGSTKAAANYDLTSTTTATSYSGTNLLRGSDAATTTTGDGYHYKLSYGRSGSTQSSVFGWYWGAQNGGAFRIDAHKAWLVLPRSVGARSFSLDGETTGIQTVEQEEWTKDNWYDLQGRRISKPTVKGVYINNGKKVMVK